MDYTARMADEDYLRVYGFARPVRTRKPRTPERIAARAQMTAHFEEAKAKQATETKPRPTAAQYAAAAR